ncbi:hypothetical protein B0H12DRAFT_585794 [Mycena haematopus]|nr:hypothetical protein B0H12DRAFT_585794 [Mycena haematopus]
MVRQTSGGLRDVKRLPNHPSSIKVDLDVEVELTVSPRSSRNTDIAVLGVQTLSAIWVRAASSSAARAQKSALGAVSRLVTSHIRTLGLLRCAGRRTNLLARTGCMDNGTTSNAGNGALHVTGQDERMHIAQTQTTMLDGQGCAPRVGYSAHHVWATGARVLDWTGRVHKRQVTGTARESRCHSSRTCLAHPRVSHARCQLLAPFSLSCAPLRHQWPTNPPDSTCLQK